MALTKQMTVRQFSFDRKPRPTEPESPDFDQAVVVGTIVWTDTETGETITREVTRHVDLTPTQVVVFVRNLKAQVHASD
jgi:hypothetical protein